MRGHGAALLAAVAILAATAMPAQAAPGDPDPSFGGGGVVTNPGGAARALVIQPDGKIVAAGEVVGSAFDAQFRLARYDTNGAPDAGFGASGVVTTPHLAFGLASDERAEALAIQADGKLLVAGTALMVVTGYDFALARYNPDGTLDSTFGSGGTVTTDFAAQTDWAKAVTIQPDGKIVVAGFAGPGDPAVLPPTFALARYNANGTLDPTFGGAGKVLTPIPGSSDSSIEALARDASGRLVVAGRSAQATGSALTLARYNPGGTLDGTFAAGGIALTQLPDGDAAANALLIQAGKPVVAGSRSGATPGFLLARYDAAGSLDPTFGSGGLVTTTFPTRDLGGANALAADSAGRLVAAGSTAGATVDSGPDFALARYSADGALDASFGAGGTVIDDLGGTDEAQALQLQPDDKPVAAGFGDSFFALARYKSAAAGDAADLALSVASRPEPVTVGDLLSYTITVANAGPGDAAGIVVTAPLAADSSFERVQSDQGFCTEAGNTVTCNLRALLPGRSTTVTIVVIPNSPGTLTVSVGATASTPDPSQANNSATTSSTVTPARGSWGAAASFSDGAPRVTHPAVVLADGTVLVPGGQTSGFAPPLASAQLYGAGGWAATLGPLGLARQGHTATLLQGQPFECGANCGKVLVAGGFGADGIVTSSAELYDPTTGTWTPTGDLNTARAQHTATLLRSGKVLVIGGIGPDSGATGESLSQAELFDPATGRWTAAADMAFGRESHSATLLPSGKVLAVGGYRGFAHDTDPTGALAPPELYDPQLDAWVGAGDHLRRRDHTATLLRDGTVLVVGGDTSNCACPTAAAELYDPADGPTGTWRFARLLTHARSAHTATLLGDGEVLVTGGLGPPPGASSLRSAELYDPAVGGWSSAGVMETPRSDHSASLLGDGSVLVAGGSSTRSGDPQASAELFTPPPPASPPGPPSPATATAAPGVAPGRTATRPGCPSRKNLITGTARKDRLTGTSAGDIILARGGADVVDGVAGDDCLYGEGGADRLLGGRGADRLFGGAGNDRLLGGIGADRINGGRGRDRIIGGSGNDRIEVRDGERDSVNCGEGRDTVVADARDVVAGNCEVVRRPVVRRRARSTRAAASRPTGLPTALT